MTQQGEAKKNARKQDPPGKNMLMWGIGLLLLAVFLLLGVGPSFVAVLLLLVGIVLAIAGAIIRQSRR